MRPMADIESATFVPPYLPDATGEPPNPDAPTSKFGTRLATLATVFIAVATVWNTTAVVCTAVAEISQSFMYGRPA